MAPNPERRTQILDAAIDILCDDGVGGLTHRQVDGRAGVPAGTTSN
jgi:DNA-binding transcriptional regulator YbjK